jgi:hypothetical protein
LAAVTAPSRGSLLGKVAASFQARAKVRGKVSKAAYVISDHVGTFAALAAADVGMWHLGPVWGWVSTGVAILIAESKVR